jgi:hypothetical protein
MCLPVWDPSPLLGNCLGRSNNFVGSKSGLIQNFKLLQNIVSNRNQHPPLPPRIQNHTACIYTVKRVDGKLRQPARMTQYSSIRGTEHFFYRLIELIRRFLTMKMDYFEAQWNFPTVFVITHRSFPTIFRRKNQSKI